MGLLEKKVIQSIVYFSHFGYAPTFKELHIFLEIKISAQHLKSVLKDMEKGKNILQKEGRYTIGEYIKNIDRTIQRTNISTHKKLVAQTFISSISRIPTVKLLGLSGSVAMNNAESPDDVDIFLITSHKRMWITRLLALGYAQLLGLRRKRAQTEAKDLICLNMFMDEGNLTMPAEKRSLYIAHEVLQMKPLVSKYKTYERFLTANCWIFSYFPNAEKYYIQADKTISKNIKKLFPTPSLFGNLVELFAKEVQLWLINRHRTNERITDTQLWFFPKDYEKKLQREQKKKAR